MRYDGRIIQVDGRNDYFWDWWLHSTEEKVGTIREKGFSRFGLNGGNCPKQTQWWVGKVRII